MASDRGRGIAVKYRIALAFFVTSCMAGMSFAASTTLTCASLFIAGGRDPKYAEIARRASDAVPGSRCVIVPLAGHAVHLEAPEEFAEALATHWNIRHRAQAAARSHE